MGIGGADRPGTPDLDVASGIPQADAVVANGHGRIFLKKQISSRQTTQ
jgi:hypothetical protein